MIVNFKSWSGTKLLLGISVVFNVCITAFFIFAVNQYGVELNQRQKFEYIYDNTIIMEKCLANLEVYELNSATGSAKYTELDDLKLCYDQWNEMFKK